MRISDWSSDVCSSDLKTGQFSAGEAGWRIENISSDKIMPNYFFDQSELAWYTASWMAILNMSMDQVASLRRPGPNPLLHPGHYSVSDDLIRTAKSGRPDTPDFAYRTDPASSLQLPARGVYALKHRTDTRLNPS